MRQRDIVSRPVLTETREPSQKSDSAVDYKERKSGSRKNVRKTSRRNREGRRVVITGIGVISPIGIGKTEFVESLRNSRNGIDRISSFDPSFLKCQIAGEVDGFDPLKYMDRKSVMRTGRSTQFATCASMMAVEDSELDLASEDPTRVGVIIGSAVSGLEYAAKQYERYAKDDGKKQVSPYTAIVVFGGACSSEVSISLGIRGPSHTISTGCASGNDSLGYACRYIRNGEADIMIAGGAEAPIVPIIIASFGSMKALSTRNDEPKKASRPFDKKRDGFVPSEGAGILVLEEMERAKARGAYIYTEVLGYGATSDAFHMSQPAPGGLEAIRAIRLALRDAGLEPEDIDYVNAHGTSTQLNDKTEARIIRSVFGKHAHSSRFATSSTKSMAGHSMGAAPSIGLVASILAREQGFLPPTINYEIPDPECDPDIDYVPNEPVYRQPQFILSNSFGLGGKNACIVVGDL